MFLKLAIKMFKMKLENVGFCLGFHEVLFENFKTTKKYIYIYLFCRI